MRRAGWLAMGFAAWCWIGCAADEGGPRDVRRVDASADATSRVCDPGATQQCVCPSGATGAQACSDDGARWDSCVCEGGTDGGNVGVDVTPPRDSGGHDVIVPSTCGAVPFTGRCASNTRVEACTTSTGDGSTYVAAYDCFAGEACRIGADGRAGCVLIAPCREGDTQCASTTSLRTCSGGAWVTTACPRQCIGSPIGDFCGADVSTTTLTGSVTYEAQGPNSALTDWDPTIYNVPAQGFLVLSFRGNDIIDARVTTSDMPGGQFSILVPSLPTASDHVVVAAVGADARGAIAYALASPGFATAGTRGTDDAPPDPNLWAWSWNSNSITSPASLRITEAMGSGAARRFAFLGGVYNVAAQIFARPGIPVLAWTGYGTTYDCGNCFNTIPSDAIPGFHFGAQIWFGTDAQNEEYWADAVTAHELGHWVMASYSTPPGEGGPHAVGGHVYPGMAWSEGFATFFSSDVRADSGYFDKQGGTAFWFDLASRAYSGPLWSRPSASLPLTQLIDENEVAAMLWRITTSSAAACTGNSCPMYIALASPHMRAGYFPRGYTRHLGGMLDTSGNAYGAYDTYDPAPFLADYLDALECNGFDRTAIDNATDPFTNYPYPSASPLCP